MKLVIAYIRPELLTDVTYALHEVKGLRGTSICEGRGFGAWRLDELPEDVQREPDNFRDYVRLEIACADGIAESVTKAICEKAHTGRPGDGVVFRLNADQCIRIRTGEPDEGLS